ncbi:M3 family metallopeptidase [Microbaculum marinum]|uniref:M3 family metallopeptidase n=1 Tax=Microbaculum marinum TaxID=1764581 RepID=A0AAW9RPN9_9HYPH
MTSNKPGTTHQSANPLLRDWHTPHAVPPFAEIDVAHFAPAFEAALKEHDAELAAIAGDPGEPTFDNTIVALEKSGQSLRRVSSVFFNLAGAHTNDALQAIEREIAPVLSRHSSAIFLNESLFSRVDDLFARTDALGLDSEQARVLERYHTAFVRNGASLDPEGKKRVSEIAERLATLGIRFGQNVLADEKDFALVLESEEDLAGLPETLVDAAAQAAADRGLPGKHVITLSRSSIEPFLQYSARRDLRETAFNAWIARGERGGETDNRSIIAEMVALRAERAALQGYQSFAHFRLDDSMAGTPEAALGLLQTVWGPARARALNEQAALQELVSEDGANFELAPWDWRYYSERKRAADFDLDEGRLKPYLQLDRIIDAAFYTANRLFGLSFTERDDVPVYHPDVRVWEVTGRDGRHVGLFLGDYFARSSKRSGAWMSSFRSQEKLTGDRRPIVVNVCNFAKASANAPTLLSFDDAHTLFHEFGHALHGLLSDVTYPMISGTSVARDFVEFPSQIYEHWLERPEVLQKFAVHYRTGEPMPPELLERLLAARNFNQGFATVEYLSSAMVDMMVHMQPPGDGFDIGEFEGRSLEQIGMPRAIAMRHRPPHFLHVFAGDGYSAAYYSYMWSEVLDADGFDAFVEAGDPFDPDTANRLYQHVYSAGGRQEPAAAYEAFRGRPPVADSLLKKRGLADA